MTASLVLVITMAVMYACGIYLLLERSMTRVLVGFLLLGNATNILILIIAGRLGAAPIIGDHDSGERVLDPLPQALALTAIVITFGLSAFLLALIYRSWHLGRADHVEDDETDLALGSRSFSIEDEQSDPEDRSDTDFEDVSAGGGAATSTRAVEGGDPDDGGESA